MNGSPHIYIFVNTERDAFKEKITTRVLYIYILVKKERVCGNKLGKHSSMRYKGYMLTIAISHAGLGKIFKLITYCQLSCVRRQ